MASEPLGLAAFAERVLRRPLWEHQLEAAESRAFITVIAKARRTGGTTLIQALAAWTCFRERNVKAVILSAGQEASRRVTEELGADLAASKLTSGAVVDDFATRIRLTNGSEIVSLPASQRQVRGLGRGVKLVVVDEAGFVPGELWRAASYVALDERGNGSRILLVGTPWGGPDHFFRRSFEAGQTSDPDHASYQWKHVVNPLLDHAYLERQRDRVSPQEYAAEVLGEWSDAAGSLFPWALLERNAADLELPPLFEIEPPARSILSLDVGVSFDRSASVAVYRLPVGSLNPDHDGRSVFLAVPHAWPVATPLSTVVDDVLSVRSWPRFYVPESSGVGAMPAQDIARRVAERVRALPGSAPGPGRTQIVPIHTTSARKTAGYGAILGLLEQGRLVLPRDPTLLRQLAGLRFEQGERGFTRIEAEDAAVHDDVADALMLAAMPETLGGRTVSHLAKLAGRSDAPEAEVPELDEATVTTGGGLRVYRRPPLQSVGRTGELTLPPGATTATRVRPLSPGLLDAQRRVTEALEREQQQTVGR